MLAPQNLLTSGLKLLMGEGSCNIEVQGTRTGVPLTGYPWSVLCSTLGFLGITTRKYPRAFWGLYYRISHDGVCWDRGTSNYPLRGWSWAIVEAIKIDISLTGEAERQHAGVVDYHVDVLL